MRLIYGGPYISKRRSTATVDILVYMIYGKQLESPLCRRRGTNLALGDQAFMSHADFGINTACIYIHVDENA